MYTSAQTNYTNRENKPEFDLKGRKTVALKVPLFNPVSSQTSLAVKVPDVGYHCMIFTLQYKVC